MTVLLGANGAGKTTTLRAICGMVRSEGEILFAGEAAGSARDRSRSQRWAWPTCRKGEEPSSA